MAAAVGSTKFCPKCAENKPLDAFGRDGKKADGLKVYCKPCRKIEGAADYARHAEARRAKHAIWRDENKEKMRPYYAAYYQTNKKKCNAATAAWAKAHPEYRRIASLRHHLKYRDRNLAKMRARWAADRGRHAVQAKLWREANKETKAALSRSYKARKRGAAGNHTGADIKQIVEWQRGKCAYCRVPLKGKYHVDHIQPLAAGGSNDRQNLQVTCARCNTSKRAADPIDFARRLGRLL